VKPDNRQKLLLLLTIAVAALYVGDKLIYSPLVHLAEARSNEVKKLRLQVKRGKALLAQEQAIRNDWADKRTNMLPDNQSFAQEQVLKAFQDWAQESGVSLNGTVPQWKNGETPDYKTLVCRVDASGTLWMLSRFIYNVEKGPMGLRLESVDLNSRDNTGQQLTLGLQVSGLVLTSPEK
jgi:hypothetical protein